MTTNEAGLVVGGVFEAGEKLSFDCRLRWRAFLGGILIAAVLDCDLPTDSHLPDSLHRVIDAPQSRSQRDPLAGFIHTVWQ